MLKYDTNSAALCQTPMVGVFAERVMPRIPLQQWHVSTFSFTQPRIQGPAMSFLRQRLQVAASCHCIWLRALAVTVHSRATYHMCLSVCAHPWIKFAATIHLPTYERQQTNCCVIFRLAPLPARNSPAGRIEVLDELLDLPCSANKCVSKKKQEACLSTTAARRLTLLNRCLARSEIVRVSHVE